MEGLLNLYADLDNPSSNFNKKQSPKKQSSKIQKKVSQPKKPSNAPKKPTNAPKNKVYKNEKKSNDINYNNNIDKYDPLSILAPKKYNKEDNDDNNIIVGKQNIKSKINIDNIEKIIDNLNDKKYKYKSVEELQQLLKKKAEENNLNSEEEKAFLVYCWITKNLSYYIGNKPDNSPLGALQKRITQCSGYSRLFKELLKIFNIKSILVHGCGRTYSLNPKPKIENHEWNAIKLNGEYYLCEVTWGSGKVENGKYIP